MEIPKISRRRQRSVDDAELGHFTFLFCRGRQRNVQRFITHVHSYCFGSLNLLFGDVLVAVVVAVCSSSLLSHLLPRRRNLWTYGISEFHYRYLKFRRVARFSSPGQSKIKTKASPIRLVNNKFSSGIQ